MVRLGIDSDQQERTSAATKPFQTKFAACFDELVIDVWFEWICNKPLFIAAD